MKKSGYDARIVGGGISGTFMADERAENEYNGLARRLGKKKLLE